jgi:DnaJ-class molecular chaperone
LFGRGAQVRVMTTSEALVVFGFDPFARPTLAAARARYHVLAQQHHPDRGGRQEDFVRVSQAWGVLSHDLVPTDACSNCGGRGFTLVVNGFHTLRSRCAACRGTGRTDRYEP